MKRFNLMLLLTATLMWAGCGSGPQQDTSVDTDTLSTAKPGDMDTSEKAKVAVAVMEAKSGSTLSGRVVFTEKDGKVTMEAEINGVPEGKHAIHIHDVGDCSAEDGSSAGGHWNPTDERHGKWGDAEGYHKGDIGNFETDANGHGTMTMTTDEWCVGCDDPTKNVVGHSMVIHDGVDDFVSQPAGNAGKRIGCGVIQMQ